MQVDLKPYSLILVCVMPSIRDMEIARLLGWYRIPFRTAPKVVDVDFLAFYQTSIFPLPEGGRINYIAAVKGNELTTGENYYMMSWIIPGHMKSISKFKSDLSLRLTNRLRLLNGSGLPFCILPVNIYFKPEK